MYKSGDYEIDNSLRMNGNADLDRTPDASNRRTYTLSAWVKRNGLSLSSTKVNLLDVYVDTNNFTRIGIESNDQFSILSRVGNQNKNLLQTSALLRDTSSWYHFVCAVDTTNGTANDRVKIYINGVEPTVGSRTNPEQNYDGHINAAVLHDIGKSTDMSMDAYIAEYNFIDGLALDASYFGETDNTYGHWKPIKYAGAYGNEGFYLDFKSSGVGTAGTTTVGADRSGNGNHYTSSNIAVTDQMLDSPTNNFCTWNNLMFRYNVANAVTEGDTKISFTSSGTEGTGFGSHGGLKSGKWYWETFINAIGSGTRIGISTDVLNSGNSPTDFREYLWNVNDGSGSNKSGTFDNTYGADFTDDDIIGVALDVDNGTLTFYKNNSSQGTAFTDILSAVPAGGWMPMSRGYGTATSTTNWGQDSSFAGADTDGAGASDAGGIGSFYYAPPSGFLALCRKNLPEPTVVPTSAFKALLYTADDSSDHDITGVGFQPDFVFIKGRESTADGRIYDAVRGANKTLTTTGTYAEFDAGTASGLTSFDSDGFNLGSDNGSWNTNARGYVAWNWKANGSGSSNTNGSINSTVSANVDAGFSIVSYTGNATSGATVGHGLSKAPEMIILKSRSAVTDWDVYVNPPTTFLRLNSNAAESTNSAIWNNTAPSATVFTLGNNADPNGNTETYIAYCFHSVDGYSKADGFYIGNASTDGVFNYCGFSPKWIMIKRKNAVNNWYIYDTARTANNPTGTVLLADTNAAEATQTYFQIDILSNGWKARASDGAINTGGEYIYMAFAETPFKYSNAR